MCLKWVKGSVAVITGKHGILFRNELEWYSVYCFDEKLEWGAALLIK